MNCHQIRGLLGGYVAGALPAYKGAWVVQHLAACQGCRALAETFRPAPVAAVAEVAELPHVSVVQRPRPRWLRNLTLLSGAILLAALPWVFLRLAEPPGLAGEPLTSPAIGFRATMQRHLGVALYVQSMVPAGREWRITVRFEGEGLMPPHAVDRFITVLDADRRSVPTRVVSVRPDAGGISAEVYADRRAAGDRFLLRSGGVVRSLTRPWRLLLPELTPWREHTLLRVDGVPAGMSITGFGTVGNVLLVSVTGALTSGLDPVPILYLRDAAGIRYAPARQSQTTGLGSQQVKLEYPLPKEVRPPLVLVGDTQTRKHLGPWLIEVITVP